MIRLITTRRLRRILGDYDREATLNNDLLTELEEVAEERDRFGSAWRSARRRAATNFDAIAVPAQEAHRLTVAHEFLRAAHAKLAAYADTLTAQRDQARAIAVDLEQQLAAAGGETGRGLREQRDQALAQAETARAAAEAADIPIVAGLTPDDYVAAVRAVFDAVAPRKPDDNRRRIYIDGNGLAWIDSCQDPDGTQYIDGIDASPGREEAADKVRARTGGLRVIGATK